jgi:hypothetical protein
MHGSVARDADMRIPEQIAHQNRMRDPVLKKLTELLKQAEASVRLQTACNNKNL